jgi:hypothetical protein
MSVADTCDPLHDIDDVVGPVAIATPVISAMNPQEFLGDYLELDGGKSSIKSDGFFRFDSDQDQLMSISRPVAVKAAAAAQNPPSSPPSLANSPTGVAEFPAFPSVPFKAYSGSAPLEALLPVGGGEINLDWLNAANAAKAAKDTQSADVASMCSTEDQSETESYERYDDSFSTEDMGMFDNMEDAQDFAALLA